MSATVVLSCTELDGTTFRTRFDETGTVSVRLDGPPRRDDRDDRDDRHRDDRDDRDRDDRRDREVRAIFLFAFFSRVLVVVSLLHSVMKMTSCTPTR